MALLAARICHAVGVKADTIEGLGRLVGAAGTALVLAILSIWAILSYFGVASDA
jgi:uncharacterized membrane protein YecN with MAPEG domain